MTFGVASVLGFVGIVLGILGIILADILAIFLSVALFGIAIIALDSDLSELRARVNAMGGGPHRGWAPTCPSCGLDIAATDRVCPHCGKPVPPPPPRTP